MTGPAAASGTRRRIYLVDGSGYIFRAFHALPPMTRSDGTPINAVRGFCAMLQKLLDDTDAEALFDRLGLREHLTAQRSNGLRALVDRIKSDADALHATV